MLVLVLPAYNESEAIGPLLDRVAPAFRETEGPASVLLVDDGSADGTADLARAKAAELGLELEVAAHDGNRGLGAALRTGLSRGTELAGGDGVVVVMDTDNTHDPALIPTMAAKLTSGFDVVIASRYAPGGKEVGLSPRRRVMSRGASLLLRLLVPVRGARDYSCGYRVYRASTLRRAFEVYGDEFITESGFVSSAEILLKCAWLPARIGEVPLVLRYDLKGGASKMNVGATVRRYLRLAAAGKRTAARARRAAARAGAGDGALSGGRTA
ncbi:MAG: glycosyltransferase [Candidatus Eisenbacteria bacterium]|nr:glycosyltransferase [Candidatus Eisenbacteria bacterium]